MGTTTIIVETLKDLRNVTFVACGLALLTVSVLTGRPRRHGEHPDRDQSPVEDAMSTKVNVLEPPAPS